MLEEQQECSGRQSKHYSEYYQIVWINEENTNCEMGLQAIKIKKSKLFFIRPGQYHNIFKANGVDGCIISFTDSFLELEGAEMDITNYNSLFQMLNNDEGVAIDPDLIVEFQEIMVRMQKEYNNNHLFSVEILRRYLRIFLLSLTRNFEEHFKLIHQTRNMELVQRFMTLLEAKFKTQKMVSAYARELYVTPNYLNEVIKKKTGFSAGYHIRQRVVLEAKRLAQYSNMCMKEIAYNLDFGDSAHFSKFFKTVTGNNFSDFKKEKLSLAIAD